MDNLDYVLIAATYLAKIRNQTENAHALKIRCAKKVLDAVNSFIEDEVKKATSKSRHDQSSMTWDQVGSALELSKSAVYARYGKAKDGQRGTVRQPD